MGDREDIRVYVGLSENNWSGVPVAPGQYACVSPISGRSQETKRGNCPSVPNGTLVMQVVRSNKFERLFSTKSS